MSKKAQFQELSKDAFDGEIIKKLVFSRPTTDSITKVSARLVAHRGRKFLAFEYSLPHNTVSHKNVTRENLGEVILSLLGEYRQANLITTLGDVEWKISSSGKEVLLGGDKLQRKLTGESRDFERAVESLDNKKQYLIPPDEEFLIKLGISDKSGRVHDKKQGKYRQINRFVEHISDIYDKLPRDKELVIYDLCCGKSYLSFAVYHYLTKVKNRRVRMLGVDLKGDCIKWCDTLAKSLGYVGMTFICDDVKNTPRDEEVDMVISLHACDVATDVVINQAIEIGAKVILSTPCCHKYLNDRINNRNLSFVTRHPHLRNKLCEALTDGIRAARLEKFGYEVKVVELTDPDDTPKNTLIRAIKKKDIKDGALCTAREDYERILDLLLGDGRQDYLKEIQG